MPTAAAAGISLQSEWFLGLSAWCRTCLSTSVTWGGGGVERKGCLTGNHQAPTCFPQKARPGRHFHGRKLTMARGTTTPRRRSQTLLSAGCWWRIPRRSEGGWAPGIRLQPHPISKTKSEPLPIACSFKAKRMQPIWRTSPKAVLQAKLTRVGGTDKRAERLCQTARLWHAETAAGGFAKTKSPELLLHIAVGALPEKSRGYRG